MPWYTLYLDDLYYWYQGFEQVPETPPPSPKSSPKTVIHRTDQIELKSQRDKLIQELKNNIDNSKPYRKRN